MIQPGDVVRLTYIDDGRYAGMIDSIVKIGPMSGNYGIVKIIDPYRLQQNTMWELNFKLCTFEPVDGGYLKFILKNYEKVT